MGDILNKAVAFAVGAHAGQCRKGTQVPYILHPMEAAVIVGSMTVDDEVLAAAVLHDVAEDTDFTVEDIRAQFGPRVAELVAGESENKREDLPAEDTWKLRKQETLQHLENAPLDVQMIALGDKLSNMRAISRDYAQLGDALWQRFNQKDKAQHGWYYGGIARCLAALQGSAAYAEYTALVQQVFG